MDDEEIGIIIERAEEVARVNGAKIDIEKFKETLIMCNLTSIATLAYSMKEENFKGLVEASIKGIVPIKYDKLLFLREASYMLQQGMFPFTLSCT